MTVIIGVEKEIPNIEKQEFTTKIKWDKILDRQYEFCVFCPLNDILQL